MYTLHMSPALHVALAQLLEPLSQVMDTDHINAIISTPAKNLTREHLYKLSNERHRQGVGLNFYADAADSVSTETLPDGVEIRIDKAGIAQRYYGGDIEPVNRSHLWIPAKDSPAEGRVPREFWPFDKVVFTEKGQGFAIKEGEILFWLVSHVHQDPDPSVLPTTEQYKDRILAAVSPYIDAAFLSAPTQETPA
jgi:hypothetical protein